MTIQKLMSRRRGVDPAPPGAETTNAINSPQQLPAMSQQQS
jgi:hypothetical protein